MSVTPRLFRGAVLRLLVSFLASLPLAGTGPSALAAQSVASSEIRVDTGVDPDTVTVGERFRSAMRLRVPAGYRVEFQDVPVNDTLEAASPVQVLVQGDSAVAALFEMVAWMTGDSLGASVSVRVIAADGVVTEHELPLALPVVASVLPAGDEAIDPRPLKGLLVPPRAERPFPWWWLLVAAAVIAALFYAWWRSRRGSVGRVEDPRQWAIAELDALLVEDGGVRESLELYRRGSWVLRSYLAEVTPWLGTELTTGELVRYARAEGMEDGTLRDLGATLDAADQVKFSSGHSATLADAREALQRMRGLVLRYPVEVQGAEMPRRAA